MKHIAARLGCWGGCEQDVSGAVEERPQDLHHVALMQDY
jgi:hypothetical protein